MFTEIPLPHSPKIFAIHTQSHFQEKPSEQAKP
jgi:hypothetical protein